MAGTRKSRAAVLSRRTTRGVLFFGGGLMVNGDVRGFAQYLASGLRYDKFPDSLLSFSGRFGGLQDMKKVEGKTMCLNPYERGRVFNHKGLRVSHNPSVLDALIYIAKIDTLLPWRFVFSECLYHGINYVGTDISFRDVKKGVRGTCFIDDNYSRHINLNPWLYREEIACDICKLHGIDIEPDEIYFFIWFHEIGHFVHEEASRNASGCMAAATLTGTYDPVRAKRAWEKAERLANEYAVLRFLELKRVGWSDYQPNIAPKLK